MKLFSAGLFLALNGTPTQADMANLWGSITADMFDDGTGGADPLCALEALTIPTSVHQPQVLAAANCGTAGQQCEDTPQADPCPENDANKAFLSEACVDRLDLFLIPAQAEAANSGWPSTAAGIGRILHTAGTPGVGVNPQGILRDAGYLPNGAATKCKAKAKLNPTKELHSVEKLEPWYNRLYAAEKHGQMFDMIELRLAYASIIAAKGKPEAKLAAGDTAANVFPHTIYVAITKAAAKPSAVDAMIDLLVPDNTDNKIDLSKLHPVVFRKIDDVVVNLTRKGAADYFADDKLNANAKRKAFYEAYKAQYVKNHEDVVTYAVKTAKTHFDQDGLTAAEQAATAKAETAKAAEIANATKAANDAKDKEIKELKAAHAKALEAVGGTPGKQSAKSKGKTLKGSPNSPPGNNNGSNATVASVSGLALAAAIMA